MASPPADTVWRRLAAPLAVVLVALTVRVSFQRSAEAYPRLELIRNALDDQVLYDSWAKSIVAGREMDWAGSGHEFAHWAARWPGVFPQDPGFALLLALFYRVFGFAYDGVRALQAAMGAATAWLTWALARRHVGSAAAVPCGLAAALYQPLVFYEATLLREPAATFLCAAALLALAEAARTAARSRAIAAAAAAGVSLGAATLIRSHLALPAAAAAVWLFAETRRRRGVGPAAALTAAAALVVAPVVAVNVARSGGPAFVSSAAPYNLFVGNVHDATGGPSPRYLEVKAQGPPASVDLLAALRDDVASHPGAFLRRLAGKAATLFGAADVPDNLSVPMGAATAAGLRLALVSDLVLVPPALAGIGAALLCGRRHALLPAYVLAYAGSVIPFIVVSRLRLPLLPAMAVLAGLGVERLLAAVRERRRAVAAAIAVGWVALTAAMWPGPPRHRSVDFLMAAAAEARLGELREAAGDVEGALAAYGRAASLNPDHLGAVRSWVRLRSRRPAPALDAHAAALCAEARAAAHAGRHEESLRLLDRAVAIAPGWALPYRYRANVHVLRGDARSALADVERAVALDPGDERERQNLAALRRATLARRPRRTRRHGRVPCRRRTACPIPRVRRFPTACPSGSTAARRRAGSWRPTTPWWRCSATAAAPSSWPWTPATCTCTPTTAGGCATGWRARRWCALTRWSCSGRTGGASGSR